MSRFNATRVVLPFAALNDFEVEEEARNPRTIVFDRLRETGFRDFVTSYLQNNQQVHYNTFESLLDYVDIDEFNIKYRALNKQFSLIHINCRRVAANKGKILALLLTLENTFGVIVLSEIGDDAENYINDQFLLDYEPFTNPPTGNKYGGVAILVHKDIGPAYPKEEYKLHRDCPCKEFPVEDLWV